MSKILFVSILLVNMKQLLRLLDEIWFYFLFRLINWLMISEIFGMMSKILIFLKYIRNGTKMVLKSSFFWKYLVWVVYCCIKLPINRNGCLLRLGHIFMKSGLNVFLWRYCYVWDIF